MVPRFVELIRRLFQSGWIQESLLAIPRIVLLIPGLMKDNRVPLRTKLALTGLGVYLVSPWDIIPDSIPGIGELDDVVVLLLFVDGILNQVDDAVLLEHWRGRIETLRRLQDLSRLVSAWSPEKLKTFLFGQAVSAGESYLRNPSSETRTSGSIPQI
jgi:uncharacterized membrane protein YkvA (DUF1232 family)